MLEVLVILLIACLYMALVMSCVKSANTPYISVIMTDKNRNAILGVFRLRGSLFVLCTMSSVIYIVSIENNHVTT